MVKTTSIIEYDNGNEDLRKLEDKTIRRENNKLIGLDISMQILKSLRIMTRVLLENNSQDYKSLEYEERGNGGVDCSEQWIVYF